MRGQIKMSSCPIARFGSAKPSLTHNRNRSISLRASSKLAIGTKARAPEFHILLPNYTCCIQFIVTAGEWFRVRPSSSVKKTASRNATRPTICDISRASTRRVNLRSRSSIRSVFH